MWHLLALYNNCSHSRLLSHAHARWTRTGRAGTILLEAFGGRAAPVEASRAARVALQLARVGPDVVACVVAKRAVALEDDEVEARLSRLDDVQTTAEPVELAIARLGEVGRDRRVVNDDMGRRPRVQPGPEVGHILRREASSQRCFAADHGDAAAASGAARVDRIGLVARERAVRHIRHDGVGTG